MNDRTALTLMIPPRIRTPPSRGIHSIATNGLPGASTSI